MRERPFYGVDGIGRIGRIGPIRLIEEAISSLGSLRLLCGWLGCRRP